MPDSNRTEKLSYIGALATIVLGLYLSSLHSYILFHSLIETVTIAIGFTLFIVTWNARRFMNNDCLKLLGIGYAFIALIDLLHALSYKGMNVFPGHGANLPTQLWIAARYLQAVTLCTAPALVERKADHRAIMSGYIVAVSMLVAMVYSGYFPDCFIEGKGLTVFKIGSEYLITVLLLASLYLFYRKRKFFNGRVFLLTATSIAFTVLSELSFTAYVSVYGFANMAGHFFKLAAYYLIYRAILVTGLKEPFELIFRDLKLAEEALQKAHDTLEEKVRERTGELHLQAVELEQEVAERQAAQESLQEQALLLEYEIEERRNAQDELEQRAMLAELSAEIGCTLTKPAGLREMLSECAQALVTHLDVAFARIWTLNAADNVLELQASSGMYTSIDGSHSRVPVGKFKIGRIAEEHKPHVTNAVIGDPRVHDQEWAKREGMVAFAGHPLAIEDKVVGVMAMFSRKPLSDVTLKALASVSNEIAIGIERKRMESLLAQRFDEFRTLAENSPDVIIRYDREGRRMYVNPEFERVNHLSATQVIGKKPVEISTELAPVADIFTEKLMAAMASGALTKIDLSWSKEGKPICWYVRVVPEFDANGIVVSALTIWSDISERKQIEEEIRNLNEDLEKRVRERTIELEAKNLELERMNKLFVGRELRMVELKERIRELESGR